MKKFICNKHLTSFKVRIFVNIPDEKPGGVVKIPNVSHIQVVCIFSVKDLFHDFYNQS